MGSTTSKSIDLETPVAHRRSCSSNVFQTLCIIPSSGSPDSTDQQVSNNMFKENGIEGNHSNMSILNSKGKTERNRKVKMRRGDKRATVPSEHQLGESSLSGSSGNPSSRFLSRFSFFPGSIGSRSSRAYPKSSSSSVISNDDELQSSRYGNKTKRSQGCEIFPSCFLPTTPGPRDDDSDSDSDNSDLSSLHELGRDGNNNGMELNGDLFSPRNGRLTQSREPVEQNVRFSRILSVGRLRDRVLHRPPFPELASFALHSEREVVSGGEVSENGSGLFDEIVMTSSTISNSLYGSRDLDVENIGARETGYANLLERRSNFLERRRRIRSQVHALQRMGSRFENISGNERSCIMSGQHRTGHCTCRLNNHDPNDSANARGSISRIVLLAEALFEVLDEIHQQSVVSSSRPALSSIGSVPAPIEVVEALPIKLHHNLPKHLNKDDEQCYICLLEYEDGDEVRVLPCHHEFHRLCIDKWLKEIHRICPLCRGDVCKTRSLASESS